jgi:hypothetical protein
MEIPKGEIERACMDRDRATASKYRLDCVYLDVENERVIASDGHILVRRSVKVSEEDTSGLIPKEVLEYARQFHAETLVAKEKTLSVYQKNTSERALGIFPRPTGNYPPKIALFFDIPDQPPMFVLNPEVLLKAVEAMKTVRCDYDSLPERDLLMNLAFYASDDPTTKPCLVSPMVSGQKMSDVDAECLCVLMPLKRGADAVVIPPTADVLKKGQPKNAEVKTATN